MRGVTIWFTWSSQVLDEEFDEPPDRAELLEGIAHGHLNAAREFRHPHETSWLNYRITDHRYMPHRHYRASFDLSLPSKLVTESLLKEIEEIPKPLPPPEPPKRPKPVHQLKQEEALVAAMEACTMYDHWLALKARLDALRAA